MKEQEALNRATVPKAAGPTQAIQERPQHTSRNMVVCPNRRDLNQPEGSLTSSRQANSLVNKGVMAARLLNLQASTKISNRWDMEDPPAPAAMAVGRSRRQTRSGVPQLGSSRITATDSAAIKAKRTYPLRLIDGAFAM